MDAGRRRPLTIAGAGAMDDYRVKYYMSTFEAKTYFPWYSHLEEIQSVVVSPGVTRIGNQSFVDCTALTSLTISETVTDIGIAAFGGCTQLQELTIPNSVTVIEKSAFSGCSALTEVTLSEQLAEIGEYAFSDCTNLISVSDIPSGITALPDGVFNNCEKLTSIVFPASLRSIGTRAFLSCRALQNFELPSSITTIEDSAFANCTSLTSVTIPGGLRQIGDSLFSSDFLLESVVLEDGLQQIGKGMFYFCTALQSPVIPSSVTTIGEEAFWGCKAITEVTIPEGVRTIGRQAFLASDIETVSLPNSLISIGEQAFNGKYKSIHIPSGVRTIGSRAFGGFTIREFTVAEDNNYFCADDGILYNKAKTTLVQYPRFKSSGVTSFSVPDGVKTIGTYAFTDCYFRGVVLPDTLTAINDYAFHNCDSIQTVQVPDGVKTIGNSAFVLCDILSSVRLPVSLTSIGQRAFENCPAFTSVNYDGARCQWERITIGDYNNDLTNATLTVSSEHVPAQETTETVPATCTSLGERVVTETCTVCDSLISSTTEEIPMLPHALVHHDGKAPTAAEPGWEPYETCENCAYTTFREIPPFTPDPYEALTFQFENGVLTVSGSGTIPSVSNAEDAPFAAYAADCRAIVIRDGVSAVAANAFAGLTQVDILILNGPISLSSNAFIANTGIDTVICTSGMQIAADTFLSETDICFYEPKENPHTGTAAENVNVIPYSFADDTLTFEGRVASDTYGLLDLLLR